MQIQHPAFPHDWPETMHPLGWIFLHPPSDDVGSAGIAFEDYQINALAKHVFDDLGAKLSFIEPRKETLEISVGLTTEDLIVGHPYEYVIEGANETAVRLSGALPPGLALVGDRITGAPTQPGLWSIEIHVGPLVHYQRPLNDGPLGTYNRGLWVDIDTPLQELEPELSKEQRDAIRAKLDELDAADAAREAAT
ncbi:hypothetical protein GS462_11270 [Rhodococcus hoagii]|nr:hypothetical protein [Prescottella equi]MBM4650992.1 hypothetical protein [Prescottella equi]MBM4686661.1 hypothetical protein [Prescottella equi]